MTPALEVIKKDAAESRANRQIKQSSIDAIRDTGYFRSVLPKQYGGLEVSPQEFFKASLDIAECDMGTAWATGIIAVHAYQLAIMPPKAAEDFVILKKKNFRELEISKYIPHEFNWKHLDASEMITEKIGKKKK